MNTKYKELITPRKAAEILGVTTDCLRKWEMAGKIKAVKTLGRHRRYVMEEVVKLADAGLS